MTEISAELVKKLREKTGAGMMDCKRALEKSEGDMDKAVDVLREQGIASAAKRSGRVAKEGIIYSYIHPGDRLGVLLELDCETDFVARTDEFRALAKDVSMQVAATNPLVISRSELKEDLIQKEKDIYRAQAKSQDKPEKVIDRIVQGKLEKYFQEVCLLEQPFIKDEHKTVQDVITDAVAKIGENITVKRFARFRVGE
ncbi:elongation factor Ts [candidate division WOR-1 bacterium DG_54_3]|uniref:Elongation factor Ts n=1 Tax=candidate division WOR-1 bacterium DG_54_3 TaxID=1703775 RepID=A0A0S7Y1M6_UNCSA|nr:MAG: elongation factor Ts [candidate division WOR-1 bacterium DG_54_3]